MAPETRANNIDYTQWPSDGRLQMPTKPVANLGWLRVITKNFRDQATLMPADYWHGVDASFVLSGLPTGFIFTEKKRDKVNRIDNYIEGHPKGKFDSAKKFSVHFIHLAYVARGFQHDCGCVRCRPVARGTPASRRARSTPASRRASAMPASRRASTMPARASINHVARMTGGMFQSAQGGPSQSGAAGPSQNGRAGPSYTAQGMGSIDESLIDPALESYFGGHEQQGGAGGESVGNELGSSTAGQQYGDSPVEHQYGDSTVGQQCGDPTAGHQYGGSPVRQQYGDPPVGYQYGDPPVGPQYGDPTVGHPYGDPTFGYQYDDLTVEYQHGSSSDVDERLEKALRRLNQST